MDKQQIAALQNAIDESQKAVSDSQKAINHLQTILSDLTGKNNIIELLNDVQGEDEKRA